MMGKRQVMQAALFYGFSLERHVPTRRVRRRPVRHWRGFYGTRSSSSASRRKAPKESAVCSRPPTG